MITGIISRMLCGKGTVMAIKYKKIIEEIMGEEAKKRGFSIKSHPKLIATKPLGILERTVDEQSQSLFITEDLIHQGDIYIMFEGKRMTYHYEDEETFRMAISQINEFMLREGYSKMDEWLKRPYYKREDIIFVRNNYEKDYEKYIDENPNTIINDDLLHICQMVESVYNIEWTVAKKQLLLASEILTGLMLDKIKDTYMVEGKTSNYIFIDREANIKRKVHDAPMGIVLNAYRQKNVNRWILDEIKAYFSKEEIENIGIYNEK